ncbi:beta/alpha barrel domain-containing protein [Acinetobacter faecalis]|uniref:hypothetical protein n=1 Tax=Acinetobacter faecalis TaxID=2665161 RepID=UPI00148F2E9F|nr:hypothetical protein [Acinetobacter faecalis]
MSFSILDCTLRDGGYYTNWDFKPHVVDAYFSAIKRLPVQYVEVGYRSPPKKGYLGQYFYLNNNTLQSCKKKIRSDQELAIMLNYKDINEKNIHILMSDLKDIVSLIRFACPPDQISKCVEYCKIIKSFGVKTAINIMYLSDYINTLETFEPLIDTHNIVDYISLVDSYGSVFPEQVENIFRSITSFLKQPVGFHGHDNLSLAFANSLAAIRGGAKIIDSTILGMGRGAGNLKTELIGVYHNSVNSSINEYCEISQCLNVFKELKLEHQWGDNLAYMISGCENLPQAKVMDWLGTNRYEVQSIVEALIVDDKIKKYDESSYTILKDLSLDSCNAVIIGGGNSVNEFSESIRQFITITKTPVIYSSMKYLNLFKDLNVHQFVCLSGQEINKFDIYELNDSGQLNALNFVCLPPPRFNGSVPNFGRIYQVNSSVNSDLKLNKLGEILDVSPLHMALEVAKNININKLYLVGFDGYANATPVQQGYAKDVQNAINNAISIDSKWCKSIVALTPTLYEINQQSIFQFLQVNVNEKF